MKPKKKIILPIILVGIVVYVFLIVLSLQASSLMERDIYLEAGQAFFTAFEQVISGQINILPVTGKAVQWIAVITGIFLFIAIWLKFENEKKYNLARKDQNGSAGWNKDLTAYNKKYTDPPNSANNDGSKNMILTNDVMLNMDTWQTKRNNNVVIVGGAGTGKSRGFAKPNILQYNCSYVITDPSGELLESQGQALIEHGYKLKVFNLVDMKHSNCYNPFNYIRDDLGVMMLINCLIKNTTPPEKKAGDPFWEKSEIALLQALVFYLIKYRPKSEQNFSSVMKLLRAAEIDENNPNTESKLDVIFKQVAKKDPSSIALKQYLTFKMGAGKTLKGILISCSVRLTVFNMMELENLTGTDDIDLKTIGDEKQALFVIIPAADDTYNFLVSMMYSQLFETLYYHAEMECEGKRLKNHVRFILDEFANIGQIPNFTKKLSTMRKYEISCSIILQNLSQLKGMYKDDWEGILGNCDSFLFLGGQEYSTLEYISKELGDTTIVVRNNSRSLGSKSGSSQSFNHSARKLMTPDEIMRMPENDCILIIRGLRPFYGRKYDYTKHRNYKYTGDADKNKIYICSDHFCNEKKADMNSLSNQIVQKNTEYIRTAKENDALEHSVISKPEVTGVEIMYEMGAKKPDEIAGKFNKQKGELRLEINEEDGIETWNMDDVDMAK